MTVFQRIPTPLESDLITVCTKRGAIFYLARRTSADDRQKIRNYFHLLCHIFCWLKNKKKTHFPCVGGFAPSTHLDVTKCPRGGTHLLSCKWCNCRPWHSRRTKDPASGPVRSVAAIQPRMYDRSWCAALDCRTWPLTETMTDNDWLLFPFSRYTRSYLAQQWILA